MGEVVVDSAQTGASCDHPLSSNTIPAADTAQTGVPKNMQTQQNTNGDGYYVSCNEHGCGAHPGCGNYQQPTPLQPWLIPPPSLIQTVHPMSSSTRLEGYIYARWMEPNNFGQMSSAPLNEMHKQMTVSLPTPHPWPNCWLPGNPSRNQ